MLLLLRATLLSAILSFFAGSSLIGVPPDYQIFPTAEDIANRRDLVLSKAVELLKGTLSPEKAYTLFPRYEERYDFL